MGQASGGQRRQETNCIDEPVARDFGGALFPTNPLAIPAVCEVNEGRKKIHRLSERPSRYWVPSCQDRRSKIEKTKSWALFSHFSKRKNESAGPSHNGLARLSRGGGSSSDKNSHLHNWLWTTCIGEAKESGLEHRLVAVWYDRSSSHSHPYCFT
jgi:hypothetical protein